MTDRHSQVKFETMFKDNDSVPSVCRIHVSRGRGQNRRLTVKPQEIFQSAGLLRVLCANCVLVSKKIRTIRTARLNNRDSQVDYYSVKQSQFHSDSKRLCGQMLASGLHRDYLRSPLLPDFLKGTAVARRSPLAPIEDFIYL
jgi:hypothetical protein